MAKQFASQRENFKKEVAELKSTIEEQNKKIENLFKLVSTTEEKKTNVKPNTNADWKKIKA